MTLAERDQGGIPPFLDRRPFIGTYTNLKAFLNCEHAMYRRYVLKDQKYVETPAMKWGNDAHAALEQRVGKGKVLPDNMKQWENHCTPFDTYEVKTEQKLAINAKGQAVDYWADDCWFRGQADVTVMINEKALFTDWKTGNPRYADKFELETGALLLKAKYPQLRTVVGRFVFLKDNTVGKMHDLSDFQKTFNEIKNLMDLINFKRQNQAGWEKKKSGLCGWCSVKDCEHHYVARP